MEDKRSVSVDGSLLAAARRRAGVRTSAAAVDAALREFVGRGNGAANGAAKEERSAKKGGRRRGGVEDFIELIEYMRESGWDGFDYKEQRRRFFRNYDDDLG